MSIKRTEVVFETEHLMTDIAGRSVRGGTITMLAQICKFILQIVSLMILARLLTPEDFGLVAMVTSIIGFVALFKDMGLSMATVQRAEINHAQISTLFWFNVVVGVIMALLVSGIAPIIVWFFKEPMLFGITIVSSLSFIFAGFTIQHQALLRRQMRFVSLAGIEVSAMIIGVVTAIVLAFLGAGYWAVVLMPIAVAMATMVGVWIMFKWKPGLPVRNSGVRSMLAFGGNVTGFNVVNYFARALDKILIGRSWGAGQLGLYERAYRLLLFPIQQINAPLSAVVIPALSRLQSDAPRYRRYYLKVISFIALVTMPLMMFTIMMSETIIRLVLGANWIGASKIFAILGVSALIQPIHNTTGWLYISTGRTDRMFRYGIIYSILIVISFFIGLPFGAIGVAISYTICMLVVFVPWFYYACQGTPVDIASVAKKLWPIVIATLVDGAALYLFKHFHPALSRSILGLIAGFVGSIIIFVAIICMIAQNTNPILEIIEIVSLFTSKNHKKVNRETLEEN